MWEFSKWSDVRKQYVIIVLVNLMYVFVSLFVTIIGSKQWNLGVCLLLQARWRSTTTPWPITTTSCSQSWQVSSNRSVGICVFTLMSNTVTLKIRKRRSWKKSTCWNADWSPPHSIKCCEMFSSLHVSAAPVDPIKQSVSWTAGHFKTDK